MPVPLRQLAPYLTCYLRVKVMRVRFQRFIDDGNLSTIIIAVVEFVSNRIITNVMHLSVFVQKLIMYSMQQCIYIRV